MQSSVLEYLEKTCIVHPDRIAVEDENGMMTYSELKELSLSVCYHIMNWVNERNRPIMVLLPKDRMIVPVFLGILYSGNIYSPTEITYPIYKIKAIIKVLCPAMIITTRGKKGLIDDFAKENNVKLECIEEIEFEIKNNIVNSCFKEIISTDPVYILFTSGSTGIPKGVVICNQNIIDYIDWVIDTFGISCEDKIGNQAPFYFDNSTLDIYSSLATGATLSIIPKRMFSFPDELMEYIRDKGITTIFWVPSVLAAVSNADCLSRIDSLKLTRVLFAGEVLQTKHLNYWMDHIHNAMFANLYGPTEITVDCTYYIIDHRLADSDSIPIGIPCKNCRVFLIDDFNNIIHKPNTIGEIAVEGISVSLGYWNNEEQTRNSFIQNPCHNNYRQNIYKTGDLAYYNSDNNLVYVGRKDSQIKHMGYRIELGEIENMAALHPSISQSYACYDNDKIYLFCESSIIKEAYLIKQHLLEYVPKYMMPEIICVLDRFPLNDNGKIDRKKLKEYLKTHE